MKSGKDSRISWRARGFEQEHDFAPLISSGTIRRILGNYSLPSMKRKLFLKNGAVVYIDLKVLEFCTPTYTTVEEAVLYEKTLEIYGFLLKYGFEKIYSKKLHILKNNVGIDEHGRWVSHGTHRSMCVDRKKFSDLSNVLEHLVPFIVTRIFITGSGGIYKDKFSISPRANFIEKVCSLSTMHDRGLFNLRNLVEYIIDEETGEKIYGFPRNYCDSDILYRLHDINFEGLRCPYNIYLVDGILSLVIQAYEGGFLKKYKIRNPVKEIKNISSDDSFSWKLEVGNKRVCALEVMNEILNDCEMMLKESYYGEEDRKVLKEARNVLEKIDNGLWEELYYKLDWITKFILLSKYDKLDGIKIKGNYKEAILLCKSFEYLADNVLLELPEDKVRIKIGEKKSLFDPKTAVKNVERLIPNYKEKLWKKMAIPPETTRDWFMVNLLKSYPRDLRRADWNLLIYKNKGIYINNPLAFSKSYLEGKGIEFRFDKESKKYSFIYNGEEVEFEGLPTLLKQFC